MKKFFKKILINLLAMLATLNLIGGIEYHNTITTLLLASICLFLLNLIVRPLLNLLFMPINLITLGASRWVINIIIFFAVTIFVDTFKIIPVNLSPISIYTFSLPAISLSFFWSLVLVSFTVQLLSSLLSWLLD